ncbi:MAG TPA: hypothetical protein VKZ63_01020 [Kofleriaceae bacterium]|nr:hypothetical protein [Kofleriaceae bacterium]
MLRRTLSLTAVALAIALAPIGPTAGEALAGRARARSARVPKKPGEGRQRQRQTQVRGQEQGRGGQGRGAGNHFMRRATGEATGAAARARTEQGATAPRATAPRQNAQRQNAQRQNAQRSRQTAPRQRAQRTRAGQRQAALAQAQAAQRQQLVREVSAFQRMRARTTQIRSFAIAAVTGIGGAIMSKFVAFFGGASGGPGPSGGFREFGSLMSDPSFGSPIADFMGPEVAVGFVVGAAVSVAVGAYQASRLRREARAIERGEMAPESANLGRLGQAGQQLNPYQPPESLPDWVGGVHSLGN